MNNLEVRLNQIGLSQSDWSKICHASFEDRKTNVGTLKVGDSYIINFCGLPVTGELIFKHKDKFQFKYSNPLWGETQTGYFMESDIKLKKQN